MPKPLQYAAQSVRRRALFCVSLSPAPPLHSGACPLCRLSLPQGHTMPGSPAEHHKSDGRCISLGARTRLRDATTISTSPALARSPRPDPSRRVFHFPALQDRPGPPSGLAEAEPVHSYGRRYPHNEYPGHPKDGDLQGELASTREDVHQGDQQVGEAESQPGRDPSVDRSLGQEDYGTGGR